MAHQQRAAGSWGSSRCCSAHALRGTSCHQQRFPGQDDYTHTGCRNYPTYRPARNQRTHQLGEGHTNVHAHTRDPGFLDDRMTARTHSRGYLALRGTSGNWLMNDKLANRITGRGLLGNTWDLGATEAHPRTGNTVTPVDIAGMTHIAMPPRRNMTWTRISFILANADRHSTETKARNGQDTQTSRGIDAPPHS